MVKIPAGTFMMGAVDGEPDELPVHQVSLRGFEMDVTEVTVAQYAACVRAGGCRPAPTTVEVSDVDPNWRQSRSTLCNHNRRDRQSHPINCVDWPMASAYCLWAGKRLPLEEEWEYAARGTTGRKYPWGDTEPTAQVCWSKWDLKGTCPVGRYPSGDSPFGLHDMAGNVWEWTSSGYSQDYSKSRADDKRVCRGGGDGPEYVRCARRGQSEASQRDCNLGFRCAR